MPNITLSSPDGQFSAYLAVPPSGTGPGILAIHEIFGVNQDMRDHCDELADQGYFAISPDLFWRQEPGVQLTDQSGAEWKRAIELYQGLDVDKAVEDLQDALRHLRNLSGSSGKVGVLGFCLGGLLTYLMACRADADCHVGYYGVGIEDRLAESANISRPTILHMAGDDRFVPSETQASIQAGLENSKHVTIHNYPGLDHAFARHNGLNYNRQAAEVAHQRTRDLIDAELR